MGRVITTFPKQSEFAKARQRVEALGLAYEVLRPAPGFRLVGTPGLVMESAGRIALFQHAKEPFICSGWVEYRGDGVEVPSAEPACFEEDLFGEAAIMVLAPCVAERSKIRIVAHISGDLAEAFPYLNAEMRQGCYTPNGPTFTFMLDHRMISLYPRRIAVAKADELVDAWFVLEHIRRLVNETWRRRDHITPCYELREKPPPLEIYKRLPGINCGQCGQKTCLALAVSIWRGEDLPSRCGPVFAGEYVNMKDALVEICAGLGVLREDRD